MRTTGAFEEGGASAGGDVTLGAARPARTRAAGNARAYGLAAELPLAPAPPESWLLRRLRDVCLWEHGERPLPFAVLL